MLSKRKIRDFRLRPESWEKERTDKGSKCAKKIRKEIARLSPFKLKPAGVAVEEGYVPDLDLPSEHLDYNVYYDAQRIAAIETTCSNYTFEDSRIMPVAFYKGQIIKRLDVPAFVIFSMEKEKPKPLGDRCVWIHGKDVIKCPHRTEPLGGKLQHNYKTLEYPCGRHLWHRGLQTLIDELEKIVEDSKQATLV